MIVEEMVFVRDDLNVHRGSSKVSFESIYGGYEIRNKNVICETMLDFTTAYDFEIINTWHEEHLVTYKCGVTKLKINVFWFRRKVNILVIILIPKECLTIHNRLLVIDIYFKHIKKLIKKFLKWVI